MMRGRGGASLLSEEEPEHQEEEQEEQKDTFSDSIHTYINWCV